MHPKLRNVSSFKVTGSCTLKNRWKHSVKKYGWHLLVMVIIHTMQHRPNFLSPPNIAPRKFSTPPNGYLSLYLQVFRCIFHTRKNEIGIYYFISCRFSKRTKQQRLAAPKYYTPHLFATEPNSFHAINNTILWKCAANLRCYLTCSSLYSSINALFF